jgi:hypothetical protein
LALHIEEVEALVHEIPDARNLWAGGYESRNWDGVIESMQMPKGKVATAGAPADAGAAA